LDVQTQGTNTKKQKHKNTNTNTKTQTHKKERKKEERKKKKEKRRKKKGKKKRNKKKKKRRKKKRERKRLFFWRKPTGLIEELKKEKKGRLPWRNEQTPVASLLCASLFFRFVGASLGLGITDAAWAAHAAQDIGARRGVRRDLPRD
jgi:hypothetical protein